MTPAPPGRRSSRPAARPRRRALVLGLLVATVMACGGGDAPAPASPSAEALDPTTDKLAAILARGTLILSTDPAYPPQSYLVEDAGRLTDTKCAANQLTAAEVAGYDADTGKAVATALGVEACFVTPPWNQITAGNWGDRWDVAWGSGSINRDRMERLWMTQPYYSVPNHYFVSVDSPYETAADLSGQRIGACASCSHEAYLRGELEVPGVDIRLDVEDPEIVTFQTEVTGLEALVAGEIEAFLAAEPVGRQGIDDGLPIRAIETPAFTYFPSGFVDKAAGLSPTAFVERVNEIVEGLHADGSLKRLSEQYLGRDYATAAGDFDLAATGQDLP